VSKLPNWIYTFLFYAALAGIFSAANSGNAIAQFAFTSIILVRSHFVFIVALLMNSAWYRPRSIPLSALRFAIELMIAMALTAYGHIAIAALSILTLACYELARLRIAVPT